MLRACRVRVASTFLGVVSLDNVPGEYIRIWRGAYCGFEAISCSLTHALCLSDWLSHPISWSSRASRVSRARLLGVSGRRFSRATSLEGEDCHPGGCSE